MLSALLLLTLGSRLFATESTLFVLKSIRIALFAIDLLLGDKLQVDIAIQNPTAGRSASMQFVGYKNTLIRCEQQTRQSGRTIKLGLLELRQID